MRTPTTFHVENIRTWPCQAEVSPGRWAPARPMPMSGLNLFRRARIAWSVFTGRCDALKWDEDKDVNVNVNNIVIDTAAELEIDKIKAEKWNGAYVPEYVPLTAAGSIVTLPAGR